MKPSDPPSEEEPEGEERDSQERAHGGQHDVGSQHEVRKDQLADADVTGPAAEVSEVEPPHRRVVSDTAHTHRTGRGSPAAYGEGVASERFEVSPVG